MYHLAGTYSLQRLRAQATPHFGANEFTVGPGDSDGKNAPALLNLPLLCQISAEPNVCQIFLGSRGPERLAIFCLSLSPLKSLAMPCQPITWQMEYQPRRSDCSLSVIRCGAERRISIYLLTSQCLAASKWGVLSEHFMLDV